MCTKLLRTWDGFAVVAGAPPPRYNLGAGARRAGSSWLVRCEGLSTQHERTRRIFFRNRATLIFTNVREMSITLFNFYFFSRHHAVLLVLDRGGGQSVDWTTAWTGLLDWTAGLDYWTHLSPQKCIIPRLLESGNHKKVSAWQAYMLVAE